MILRGFWKRWTLLLFFVIVLIILIFQLSQNKETTPVTVNSKFTWLHSFNTSSLKHCRNSKQGPNLITDEKGYICRLQDVQYNGCCNKISNFTEQYSCLSCQNNRCCKVYENCISCCLHPHKRKLLELVLQHAQTVHNPLLSSVQDNFELCLHKCRTSSTSIRQDNTYRNLLYKYCFGMESPHITHGRNR